MLKRADIKNADARVILRSARPSELVLLDVPYVPGLNRKRVRTYPVGKELSTMEGALEFIQRDMAQANRRGIPMIYSNNYRPEIEAALKEEGFRVRIVSGIRSQRGTRTEIVAWNEFVETPKRGLYIGW